jgi:hypothetical protein
MLEPAWIAALKQACQVNSQAVVATKIGMSPAVVNQVLKGCYNGSLINVRKRVEGALLGVTVDCPMIGDIPLNRCIDNQSRPFAATNPLRVALHRACKTCVNHSAGG